MTFIEEDLITVNNTKICPVCGSDMRRESSDSPHDDYEGHYVCCNHEACGVSVTVLN